MSTDALAQRTASPARWLGALIVAALVAAGVYVIARSVGIGSPFFAFNLHIWLMAGAVWVDQIVAPKLTSRCFDVSPSEVRIYRWLGALWFMRFLRLIGWERALRDKRKFDGTRRTLASYERATRHGENSHAWLLAISIALAAWAATRGWWDATFWIAATSVPFHVYPIMLQRTQRARLVSMMRSHSARL